MYRLSPRTLDITRNIGALRHYPSGDLCERWTNGIFKSTVHRVVTRGGCERYSCAFFWEPNFETTVAPLPQCVSDEMPARYAPTTYGEYIMGKYAETHSGYDATSAAAVPDLL